MGYASKVYRQQGGSRMVIASGGEIDIETGGSLKIAGTAMTAAAAALDEAAVTQGLTASAAVAGGTLVIPVTAEYVAKTTGGVEALTLADGSPGQLIVINLVADGGTGTLTPATLSGFATIVFADAGDQAVLKFIDGTVGWVIVGLSGVAAPPVITV